MAVVIIPALPPNVTYSQEQQRNAVGGTAGSSTGWFTVLYMQHLLTCPTTGYLFKAQLYSYINYGYKRIPKQQITLL